MGFRVVGGLFAGIRSSDGSFFRVDSWATDGYKWLNLPYDCGILFVRDAAALRGAMPLAPPTCRPERNEKACSGIPRCHGQEMCDNKTILGDWCVG